MRQRLIIAPAFGVQTGIGHLVRSLALAECFADFGWQITLETTAPVELTRDQITRLGFQILNLAIEPPDPARQADLILCDDYTIDAHALDALKSRCTVLMQFQDFLEQTIAADIIIRIAYQGPYPEGGVICLQGIDYAVLRSDFRRIRYKRIISKRMGEIRSVLIAMGGTDTQSQTIAWAEQVRSRFPDAFIQLVMGSLTPHIDQIKALAGPKLSVAVDSPIMADLIGDADLVIGSGGVGCLERCCIGIPNITLIVADNQRPQTTELAKRGATLALELEQSHQPGMIRAALDQLDVAGQSETMAEAGRDAIDGRGAWRILTHILNRNIAKPLGLDFRLAEQADCSLVYDWQNQPGARTFSRNPEPPVWTDHQHWFAGVLNDPHRHLFIVSAGQDAIGFLRLDKMTSDTALTYEVSILLDQHRRGQGYGRSMLQAITQFCCDVRLTAEIDPRNTGSIRAFMAAGFLALGDRHYHRPAKH
jgi:spore coat polysaccharide biosynthesis predicted glycosyltransferase SpsG/RimJ/RimL family protein N-acetyltransferase